MIPYGRQNISQQDIDYVIKVLESDFLTQGPRVPEFEAALSAHTGATHAVAVNSATSAIHIACLALELGEGDWLWTSPITFVASANAGLYCGAKIDFVDIDSKTYNLCPDKLKKKLEYASINGCLPKVLIPVHLSGQPCDMERIRELCDYYDIKIIEDASHAIGGLYRDEPVGSCKYSDITIFSFHPVKIVTTAEGGAALTNCSQLAKRMALYRSHGITREIDQMTQASHGPWYYQQITLGYNYRMTELQAALGVSQMMRLLEFVSNRHKIAERYNLLLQDLPVILPYQLDKTYSAFHLYIIQLCLDEISVSHRSVFEILRSKGIGVNLHYIPVHMQPYYRDMGFNIGDFPESEQYYARAISLPIHPGLSEEDQSFVVDTLAAAIGKK